MSVSCRGSENISTAILPNTDLTKIMANLLVDWKITEKGLE